jgi:proline racemase
MEQVEYPPMSDTNTICVATVLIDKGIVEVKEPVTSFTLETPAGLVRVEAEVVGGRDRGVTFENVPCFAMQLDAPVVTGLGTVSVDLAYGGMIYVIADAAAVGLRLAADEARDLVRVGECIKAAAREQVPQCHPERPELVGPTIACLVGPASGPHADRRNAVVVSTGALDWRRPDTWTDVLDCSPCGTGTCAQMAVLHARGQLPLDHNFRSEGILGTVFTGRLGRGQGGRPPRRGPDHHGYRLGHGPDPLRARPRGPLPSRFHRRRHLGRRYRRRER